MTVNLARRFTLLAITLLGVLFLTQVLVAQEVEAAWNPAGETTAATYEVIPAERKVHVTLSYHLKNLDEETKYSGAYYTRWTVSIPLAATNIKAYDASKPLSFTTETEGSRTYLKLQFNKRLSYGVEYAFSIEYDLTTITQSVAVFRAYGKGRGASTVKVVLPRGYYDEVRFTDRGYTTSETDTHTIYTYAVEQEGWRFSTLVEAARKSDYLSLSGTVKLQEREVKITVKFWEDEEVKAQHILSLYTAALPILEDVIGVAFPPAYQIVVQEVTREDIQGWSGSNTGEEGILISYSSMDSDRVLVHELAHYWASWPHWKERWMKEGYADLYAYLTFVGLGEESTAEKKIMEYRTSFYEENKDQFEPLILSLWSPPDVLTEENRPLKSFGYSKSFVFMFDLYNRYGVAVFQKANQEVYKADQSVDWFDYLQILETTTGQELGPTFVGWVVDQTFGTNFDQWQSAERAYWETKQTVAEREGALGINIVEAELEKGKELIMNGDFGQALSQLQSTAILFHQWETAEKAFRDAERAIAEREGALGIGNVEAELEKGKELIMNGDFGQALSQLQSTAILFHQWETAEKAYWETKQAVAERKGALGISIVETELEKGKELIMNGDFGQALSQLQSTAILFHQWETAEKAIRDAEGAVTQAKSEGRTWRLRNAEQIIVRVGILIKEGRPKESLSQSQLAQEIADATPTPWLAIPALLAPYLISLAGLAYGVYGFMAVAVLTALILAALVSMKAPRILRDSFKSAFRRALKISPLAFALVLGVVEFLYRSELGYSGVLGRTIGLTLSGALLGLVSVLLGFWLLLLVKRLPLRTEFSKDTVYGIFGCIPGAVLLAPILEIPFAAGLILGLFGAVISLSLKTGVRNLFGLLKSMA